MILSSYKLFSQLNVSLFQSNNIPQSSISDENLIANRKILTGCILNTKIFQCSRCSVETGSPWMVRHSWARTQGHWLVPTMLKINCGPKASSVKSLGCPQAELLEFLALVCCVNIQDSIKSMVLPKVFVSCKSLSARWESSLSIP